MKKWSIGKEGFTITNYINRSCFWALLCALYTSGYSIIDKYVSKNVLEQLPCVQATLMRINYVYLQNTISLAVIYILLKWSRHSIKKTSTKYTLFCGIIFLISYVLIMFAFVENQTTYVVSFRQISIVFTVILSMLFIEKRFFPLRLAGAIVIFCGVILVGLA